MRNTLLVWLGCTFLLGGCIANYPKDVSVISIKAVDYREQAEYPAPPVRGSLKPNNPYHDFLFALSEEKGKGSISPSDIDVYFQKQGSNESFKNAKPQKPIFKLEFTSKENLHKFARDKSYPVSSTPYFCDRPEASVLLGSPYVYWRGLRIGAPLNYAIQHNEGEQLVYYAFLNVTYDFTDSSSYERFDLRTNPEDVCFQLKGGFAGAGFESNVVVIPKEKITEVLKELPSTLK